jgi:hypothetical protein
MKKTTLIILILLTGIITKSFGQKLEESHTDDFTGKTVKRTSWETLSSSMSTMSNAHFRISLVGDFETFDMKLMMNKVFSIDKDAQLMLKLDDGEVVTLQNLEYQITCKGCGATGFAGSEAEGIEVRYPLSKEQIIILKAHKVVKVRTTTNDGYFDNDIKDKNASKIQACLNLL